MRIILSMAHEEWAHTATLRTPATPLFFSSFGSPVEKPALSSLITENFLITFLITLCGIVTVFFVTSVFVGGAGESPKVRFLVRRNPLVSIRYGLQGYLAHKKTHLP